MRRRTSIWTKAGNKKEKIYRYIILILGVTFTLYILYLRNFAHPEMTNPEFTKWMWVRNNNWVYLVLFIVMMLFLFIKANETGFKKIMNEKEIDNKEE